MKGLSVLALGAILIWFGLSQGSAEPVNAGTGDESVEEVVGANAQPEAPLESRRRPAAANAGPSAEDQAAERAARQAARERELAQAAQEARQAKLESDRLAAKRQAEMRAEAEAAKAASAPLPEVGFSPRGSSAPAGPRFDDYSLTGASRTDPMRLATLLLDAWLAGEPGDLESYLKVGDGVDLPEARRQLVSAFWMALVGHQEAAHQRLAGLRGSDGISSTQTALLAAAIDPKGRRAVPASMNAGQGDPLARAMSMILLEDEGAALLQMRDYDRSALAWSDLIQLEVAAPWLPHREAIKDWGRQLKLAQQSHRMSSRGNWPAVEVKVQRGDSLTAIRKRVIRGRKDLKICTGLIAATNGIGGYLQPGDVLRVPTDPVNVIVDLDARVVLYRHGDEVVQVWECGIGRPGHPTPIGEFTVGDKIEKPAHTVLQLPYGDAGNLLGSRWMALLRDGRKTSYGFHGTPDPDGVGGEVSLGCVRMRNHEVEELFEILPMGSRVVIQS